MHPMSHIPVGTGLPQCPNLNVITMAHGASRTCLEKDDVIATVIAECVQCVYKNLNLTE